MQTASAAENCVITAGAIVAIENSVQVQPDGGSTWSDAGLNQVLCQGDTIRVGQQSRAAIQLINDAMLRLDQNTTIKLLDIVQEAGERSWLEMTSGKLKSFIRSPRALSVSTPHLNGMVEGTEFLVEVSDSQSSLVLFEGAILAQNDQGEVRLAPGETASASSGTAPVKSVVVTPRDAVQWALYYPAVLPAVGNAGTSAARTSLDEAAQLLAVGRVNEAETAIQQALASEPGSSDALALQSVIAVVQNDKDAALALAGQAVSANPESAPAYVALSFAQQATFDLNAARGSLLRATQLDPGNALAWARLAEVQSSFGDSTAALNSANRAVALDPDLARTQSVLGFSQLMNHAEVQAVESFNKAILLDQADPIPHLGLGLSLIASGDLAAGRAQMDIAAALDPNNSIIRSYLGKAYYEEKRSPLDEQQFEIAKQLDPLDPTPWFYDAIGRQTSNRPVAALKNIQEAIVRNDNRAVYRSSLLLDSDLAARSASVGRIYSDLGFQELALREGWKGVNTDPGNYSAHRLLADSYAVVPRHEIARVSELLQSQLLQPLNMTPIQPQLAISNLALISAGGAGSVSFNEFNPVFFSEGINLQASLIAGEQGTSGEEAVISGLYGKTSFSLGAFHYETDGFRVNADQTDDIANIFVQHEVSTALSVQGELRYRDTESGDSLLRFFPEDIYEDRRQAVESTSARVGARYSFNPGSVLLASYTHQEQDNRITFAPFPYPGFELFDEDYPEQRGQATELQYIFRSSMVSVTSGAGYFDVDAQLDATLTFGEPLPPEFHGTSGFTENYKTRHTNVYSYAQVAPVANLTLTLGASYDEINGDFPNEELEDINPKVGLIWEPLTGTTLRAAGFKTVKRTLVTNQTLEPTQVAGFNQFFDDIDLTESKLYGAAVDQKITSDLAGGIEYTTRESTIPYLNVEGGQTTDWEEALFRAYVLWTPADFMSVSVKYEYEELEREAAGLPSGVVESDTHRLPIGVNFFNNAGTRFSLVATLVDQEGVFGSEDFIFLHNPEDPAFRPGSDDFWVLDASFSYRLPKRYGIFSLGASNLLDQEFNYFDQDLNNSSIHPERMIFAKITLSLQ